MKKIIIPRPIKLIKGKIKGWFTIIDLFFIFLISFPIMLMPIFIGMNINEYKNLILYATLLFADIIFTFVLIYPWLPNDKKFYELLYEMIIHLLGVKKYKRNVENGIPIVSYEENFIKMSDSYTSVLEVKGINIDLMMEDDQNKAVSGFLNIFQSVNSKINVYKVNWPFEYSNRSGFIDHQIHESIWEFINSNQETLPQDQKELFVNYKYINNNISEFFKNNIKNFDQKKVNSFLKILHNLSVSKKTFHLVDEDNYESRFFVTITSSIASEVEKETNEVISNCSYINFYPIRLIEKKLKDWANVFFNLNNANTIQKQIVELVFKPSYYTIESSGEKFFSKTVLISDFPIEEQRGWLNRLLNDVDENVVIKTNLLQNDAFKDVIDKKIKIASENQLLARENSAKHSTTKDVKSLELLGQYVSDGEKIMLFMLLINIKAKSISELNERYKNLKKVIHSKPGYKIDPLHFKQKDAYSSFFPKQFDPLLKKYSTSLPLSTFAEGFPISNEIMQDENSLILGSDFNGSPVMIDFRKRDNERINSSITIFGTSGSGKSTMSKKIIKDLIIQGVKMYLIDPEDEYSYLMKKMGGNIVELSVYSKSKLNPTEIFSTEINEESIVEHISFLSSFLKMAANLTFDEQMIVPEILAIAYQGLKKKIDNKDKIKKSDFPLLYDISLIATKKAIEQTNIENNWQSKVIGYQSLATKLEMLIQDPVKNKLWNNHSTVEDFESLSTSFNIKELNSSYPKEMVNAQIYLILNFIEKKVMENKDIHFKPIELENDKNRKSELIAQWNKKWVGVVVDEAHLLIDKDNNDALKFLYRMVKRIRKYNGLTIIITQNIGDFTLDKNTIKETSGIISNSQYQFIFNLKPKDVTDLDILLKNQGGLTDSEKEFLKIAPRGTCLSFMSTSKRFLMKVEMHKDELGTIIPQ